MHALEFLGVSHARVMGLPLFGSRRKPGSVLLLADQSVRGVLCVEIVCTPIYDAASLERRTPTEPPRDARSGGALRRGWPPDTAKQPAFWYCTDLAFGYLRSDKFQSARPPDDKQSPKPSGRPPDDGDHTSQAAEFQRPWEDNLTVLLLRRLRRKTPTAREAPGPGPGWGLLQGPWATQPGSAGWHCRTGCH